MSWFQANRSNVIDEAAAKKATAEEPYKLLIAYKDRSA